MPTREFNDLSLDELAYWLPVRQGNASASRYIVGIVGIPGCGKSTLDAQLPDRLNAISINCAQLIAMDGFHLTNRQLDAASLRDRRGSRLATAAGSRRDPGSRHMAFAPNLRVPSWERWPRSQH